MSGARPTLHGYWRSSAAYRVRIALNLKGVDYSQVTHDLRAGAQSVPDYRALAPQGLVPALEADGHVFTQSPAIIEWLEERYPERALLPADTGSRAIVRGMAALIACDIHPLNNLRVVTTLRTDFGADSDKVKQWATRWIDEGFAALEELVVRHGEGFCFGDSVGLADCYLVPQLYSAERFGVDLSPYPTLCAVGGRCLALEAFRAAHPGNQPDAGKP